LVAGRVKNTQLILKATSFLSVGTIRILPVGLGGSKTSGVVSFGQIKPSGPLPDKL
jgi:hypothetical protein